MNNLIRMSRAAIFGITLALLPHTMIGIIFAYFIGVLHSTMIDNDKHETTTNS